MPQSTPVIDAIHGVIVAPRPSSERIPRKRLSPITITLIASTLFAGAYAAFQRAGTTANADAIEYTQNLAGGFLAVGMTKDQPGFILLSSLDRDQVTMHADQTSNRLAGTHTTVQIQTPHGSTSVRLRGPEVILIAENGAISRLGVDWTLDEFTFLREAADCSTHEAASKKHRCGQPFTDLHEALAQWPQQRVPKTVRAYLAPFRDHRRLGSKGNRLGRKGN